MVLPFLALFLTKERGFSPTDVGLTFAAYGTSGILGSYLGGRLAVFLLPTSLMEASLGLTGLGLFVLGHLRHRWQIVLAVAALSLVSKSFVPARRMALASRVRNSADHGRSAALNRLAENFGLTVGACVGGFLAARDYSWLFRIDGTTSLVAALFLLFSLRREELVSPNKASGPKAAAGRSPWGDTPFLFFLFLRFLLALVTIQVACTIPLALSSEYRFGLIRGANTLIVVLFEMVLVHIFKNANPLRLVAVGSFLFCLGVGLLPAGGSFFYLAFPVVIWSVGEMLTLPTLDGVVANRAEGPSRGYYVALFSAAFAVACVVAPLAGTWVYQGIGPQWLWAGCIAVGVILLVGFWKLAPALTASDQQPLTQSAD